MNSNKIALYIGGTKLRQAGFSDLWIHGLFPETEFNNMDRVTLISEKPVYIIKQTNDYILYQLIDRKVKSFDAETNGVLSIAIAIPANMQFAAGQNPYSLLVSIYQKFRSESMTPYSDGRDAFLNVPADGVIYEQIINQYSLVPRAGKYVTMGGTITGTLSVPQDKLEMFFGDTQYDEFASYKDIEIGTMCQSTPGLDNLEIPRPIHYNVYVNDKLALRGLHRKDEIIRTDVPNGENLNFTLADLEAAPGFTVKSGKSEVKLDKANECIICRIAKKEIIYICNIVIKGSANSKEIVKNAIMNGQIKVTETGAGFDIMDFHRDGLSFEISSFKLQSKIFTLDKMEYEGMKLAIKSEYDAQSIKIIIDVTETEQTIAPINRGGRREVPSQSPTTKKVRGGANNQPDNTPIFNEAKFWKEAEKREKELNAEWEKRLNNSKRTSLFVGLAIGFIVGLIPLVVYLTFFNEKPATRKPVVYEPTQEEKDKIIEEYLTDEKIGEIFNEMLAAEIKEEDFINSKVAQNILAAIAEMDKEALMANEKVKDIVEKCKDKNLSNSTRNADKITKTAFEDSKEKKDNATVNAENTANKRVEDAKEKARAEILELVKQKMTYDECYRHRQFKSLTMEDRIAVERVLNCNKKYNLNNNNLKTLKQAIYKDVIAKVYDGREITWDLLIKASKAIDKMVNNQKNQKYIKEGVESL